MGKTVKLNIEEPDQSGEFSRQRNPDFRKGMVEGQQILQHGMEKEMKHQEGFIFLLKNVMVLLTAAWLTGECTSCVPVCLWHSKSLCLDCLGVNFQAVTLPAVRQAAEAYQEWITTGDKHNFEGILWFSSSFFHHFLKLGYFRAFSWLVFTRSHKSHLH